MAGLPDGAAVLREWTSAADVWRKWRREFAMQSRAATRLLLEAALVEPGMRILDLASGSGEPAAHGARDLSGALRIEPVAGDACDADAEEF